jgi:hypothetical protein
VSNRARLETQHIAVMYRSLVAEYPEHGTAGITCCTVHHRLAGTPSTVYIPESAVYPLFCLDKPPTDRDAERCARFLLERYVLRPRDRPPTNAGLLVSSVCRSCLNGSSVSTACNFLPPRPVPFACFPPRRTPPAYRGTPGPRCVRALRQRHLRRQSLGRLQSSLGTAPSPRRPWPSGRASRLAPSAWR